MQEVKAFEWNDNDVGERIEGLIHRMTTERPRMMQEVLKIGFGDLRSWTDTGYVANAKCGCLVGSCAIAAVRGGLVAPQAHDPELDQHFIEPVALTLGEAIARGDREFASEIEDIGCAVANECEVDDVDYDDYVEDAEKDREAEVKEYLIDLIATDLRLLGLRVPKSATV